MTLTSSNFIQFLPARRYASAGYRDRNVSVCLSVRPSRAGIVSIDTKIDDLGWPWTDVRSNFVGISGDFSNLAGNHG